MAATRLITDVPVPGEAPEGAERTPVGSRVRAALGAHGLLVFVFGAYLTEQVALLRRLLTSDGWLTLLAGREIVRHGLPSTDHWTVLASGRSWVDQQWLAQLFFYGVDRVGGIPLALAVSLVLGAGTFLAALVVACRRGASSRTVAWVALVCVVPFGRSADNFRAQSLCYPLFLALVLLLAEADRRSSRRVYLVFPILVLWANLHGSVVVAAAIVSLYGIVEARRRARGRLRALALIAGPWACVLASPYALELPRYYRSVLVNPAFASYVTEWKPTTLSLLNVPLFALALAAVFMLGRRWSAWTVAERIVLAAVVVLALLAVRNGVWLALASAALLPAALDEALPAVEQTPSRRRMNVAFATAAIAGVVLATAATATRPAGWFTGGYPAAAADVAARAAGSRGDIFATEGFADWLLWRRPALAGRVAFDDRLELLKPAELKTIFGLENGYVPPRSLGGGYRVFVGDPAFARVVEGKLGTRARVVYSSPSVAVVTLAPGG